MSEEISTLALNAEALAEGENLPHADYRDGDIAIFNDFSFLPRYCNSLRINVFALMICMDGAMQVEINSKRHNVVARQCLIGRPNDVIANCYKSSDFKGKAILLAPQLVSECISDNERWSTTLSLFDNPTVTISPERIHVYEMYSKLLLTKLCLEEGHSDAYSRRSICALVRAAFYDIISDMDNNQGVAPKAIVSRSEILFRRFIDLLENSAVPERSVSAYASKLCVTPKYLSAACKDFSGETATEWISRSVNSSIRHELKYSSLTIKEIAIKLGFDNLSFFGKYVRAKFGQSPRALRLSLRSSESDKTIKDKV